MKSTRHFVFLFVEDAVLANMLNAAILALNPRERWPAHVTLAGPFESRRNIPRKLDFSRRVSVIGVHQFRSEGQNTVHFRVGAHGMREVWRKPDYPYNPHLTLYDGSDHALGDELYARLTALKPVFKFYVSQLYVVTSSAQRDFDLISSLDLSFSPKLARYKSVDFAVLEEDQRIEIAVESVKQAILYCAKMH